MDSTLEVKDSDLLNELGKVCDGDVEVIAWVEIKVGVRKKGTGNFFHIDPALSALAAHYIPFLKKLKDVIGEVDNGRDYQDQ